MSTVSPLRKFPDNRRDGNSCCEWVDFLGSFDEYYRKFFGFDPVGAQLKLAHKDWMLGLTGWEAAEMQRQKVAKALRFEDAPTVPTSVRSQD